MEWGPCKLVPTVGNGGEFYKLVIALIIEDEKIALADVSHVQWRIELDDENVVTTDILGWDKFYDEE